MFVHDRANIMCYDYVNSIVLACWPNPEIFHAGIAAGISRVYDEGWCGDRIPRRERSQCCDIPTSWKTQMEGCTARCWRRIWHASMYIFREAGIRHVHIIQAASGSRRIIARKFRLDPGGKRQRRPAASGTCPGRSNALECLKEPVWQGTGVLSQAVLPFPERWGSR
jgi:hypothetical protein